MVSAMRQLVRHPGNTLRRAAVATILAAGIAAVAASAVASADGPFWIVYVAALAACALAVMQVVLPGAGLRVPRRSRTRDLDALTAAALASGWERVETSERTEPLFEPEKRETFGAYVAILDALARTPKRHYEIKRLRKAPAGSSRELDAIVARYLEDNAAWANNVVTAKLIFESVRELDDDTRADLKRRLLEAVGDSEAVETPAEQTPSEQRR